jgi:holo-[acyl-carrier protein] synthase
VPGVIGVGTDLVDVDRFRRAVARTPGLVERVFTDEERRYADTRRDPTEALAARFAAKEATMKALAVGIGAFGWRDVEVVRADGGAPSLVLHGDAGSLAGRRGVGGWLVSLTHTATVAGAVTVALDGPPVTGGAEAGP